MERVTSFVASTFSGPPPRGLPQLPAVAKLSPRVVRVLGQNPSAFTLQGTNTYLVGTGKRRWLVDTGEGRAQYPPLLVRAMEEEGVEELAGVLLTHWHNDHVGGLLGVRRALAAQHARRSDDDRRRLDDDGTRTRVGGSPGVLCAHKRVRRGQGERAVVAVTGADAACSGPTSAGGAAAADTTNDPAAHRAYVDIADGEVFECEGATLRALFTPGHAEDHMCFVLEEEGALFAGDCVLNGNTATFEDLGQYSASLERMQSTLAAAVEAARTREGERETKKGDDDDGGGRDDRTALGRLYPSHGDVVEDGAKKLREYCKHRTWRESIFMDVLRREWRERPSRGGVTSWELCSAVYARQVSYLVLATACANITTQHLRKLVDEGRVRREVRRGWFGLWREARYYPEAAEMEAGVRSRKKNTIEEDAAIA